MSLPCGPWENGARLEGWVVTLRDATARLVGIRASDTYLAEWVRAGAR